MGVVGGKLREGFEDWRAFTENTDIEADANHVEFYVQGCFFKGAAMLLEEVARYRGFPSSGAASTWTGNTPFIPASLQGHSCSLERIRLYP